MYFDLHIFPDFPSSKSPTIIPFNRSRNTDGYYDILRNHHGGLTLSECHVRRNILMCYHPNERLERIIIFEFPFYHLYSIVGNKLSVIQSNTFLVLDDKYIKDRF